LTSESTSRDRVGLIGTPALDGENLDEIRRRLVVAIDEPVLDAAYTD
jgi:hypothetical protein